MVIAVTVINKYPLSTSSAVGLMLEAEGLEMMRPSFLPWALQTCGVCVCPCVHTHAGWEDK